MVEWLAGNRIRGTNTERASASVAQATPTKIIDGSYTVLTYTADGKFIPKNTFNVETIVVAGGGGGGGGGGGAGGIVYDAVKSVTAQNYNITIGSGGDGGDNATNGTAGSDSIFDNITANGGGYGALDNTNGGAGGSGGGGGATSSGVGTGGSSTQTASGGDTGYGFAGGSFGSSSAPHPNGGGGGSGAVGQDGSGSTCGSGGIGIVNPISGSTIGELSSGSYYLGGGGGGGRSGLTQGSGGIGGGGDGSATTGENAISHTGGGGGGSFGNTTQGNGGSGVVIIRFLTSGNTYDIEQVGLQLSLPSGSVGGWHEIGRTTLESAGDNITVSGLADKRYYMFLFNDLTEGTRTGAGLRFNSDAGTNYAHRISDVGGAGAPSTGRTSIGVRSNSYGYDDGFAVGYVSNLTAKEKLIISHFGGEGAYPNINTKIPPRRQETVGKWVPTTASNVINEFTMVNGESGDYKTGTEMVVLGWDQADTHTTNFWEELASAELSSASMRIDSGTFTAKKYLWIQIYNPVKISGGNSYVYFNNVVTGTTHSGRSNTNGRNPTNQSSQSDYELTSSNGSIINHDVSASGTGTGMFTNMFMINNASKEKLSIVHSVSGWTNAGSGVAPARFECVGKWANTTDAITSVQCGSTSVSTYMGAGSTIKVWGSD